MPSALQSAVLHARARVTPIFSQTLTFSVALQIVQPYQQSGAGTLIVLTMSVAVAVVLVSMCSAYLAKLLYHAASAKLSEADVYENTGRAAAVWTQSVRARKATTGRDEIVAFLAPLSILLAHLLSLAETLLVQFASVLIGTIIVQEAKDVRLLEPAWATAYATFAISLAWVMDQSLAG